MDYLINKTAVDISFQNHRGLTALEILNQTDGNGDIKWIKCPKIQDSNTSEPESLSKKTTSPLTSFWPPKQARRDIQRGSSECQEHDYTGGYFDCHSYIHSWYKPPGWCLSGWTPERKVRGACTKQQLSRNSY